MMALGFRLLPRRCRFGAARRLARMLQPAVQRTAAYRARRAANLDGPAEIALDLLLLQLGRHGVAFDPVLRVEGAALLRRGQPALLLSAHAMLGSLLLRWLHDQGHDACVVAADQDFPTPGTRRGLPVIADTARLPLHVRRALRAGRIVVATIDRGADERRTTRFETPHGTLRLSDALLRVGMRLGTPLVFVGTRLEHGEVVCRLEAPRDPAAPPQQLLAELAAFVSRTSALGADAPLGR